jgi:aminotransferase
MSVEARRHGEINLAQGMPDFPAPQEVKDAACRAIQADINQYATTWGTQNLREAIAEHARWHLGLDVDPDREITVTCGSTEAMLVALLALINPGDEVILTEPYYENYWPDCVLAVATPHHVPLRPPAWSFDFDELAAGFNDRTKAIVLCNPNNPTATVLTAEELAQIARLCLKWDVIAIMDEIYEHILFDGRRHLPMAALEGMRERTVTISALSKTFSVTGWRVGHITAPADLTKAFRQVHDFVTIGAAAPLQEAGAVAYRLPRPYFEALAHAYEERRDRLCGGLRELGFRLELPQGAYYVMADFSAFASDGIDDTAFALRLVREHGVATVPGTSFFQRKELGRSLIRFCFCKQLETLDAALDRLRGVGHRARSK